MQLTMSPGGAVGPYFLLSYARADDRNAYVRRFYHDLSVEVAGRMSVSGPPPGFQDTSSIGLGQDWTEELQNALGTCRTMVALYSPAYFSSDWCSREAGVMLSRCDRYKARTLRASSALIPVLWQPVDEVPAEVGHIQYLTEGLGAWYADSGLQRLLQHDPLGVDYIKAVRVIARRVVEVAEREELPVSGHVHLATSKLSFTPRTEAGQPGSTVQFFIAAGSEQDPPEHRPGAPYYGRTSLDWNPYHPQEEYPLYQQAQRLVTAQRYGTNYQLVRAGLHRQLEQAWQNDQVTILLVDAWSALMQQYRKELERFDRTEHPATGVLVPSYSEEDPDGESPWAELTMLFERKASRSALDAQFQLGVAFDQFKQTLAGMVRSAQSNLIRKRSGARPPDGDGPAPGRPILSGPNGSTPRRPRSSTDGTVDDQEAAPRPQPPRHAPSTTDPHIRPRTPREQDDDQ
jgi:FxsC-like protein